MKWHYRRLGNQEQLLAALSWAARVIPGWLIHPLCIPFVLYFWITSRRDREALYSNLLHYIPSLKSIWHLRKLNYRLFRNFTRCLVDLYRAQHMPAEKIIRDLFLHVNGLEILDQLLARGKGLIILTSHLGNWNLGAVALLHQKYQVNVVNFKDHLNGTEEAASRDAPTTDLQSISTGTSPLVGLSLLSILRAGGVVAMQGDRIINERWESVRFFDYPARFPTGPFRLAALTGAPMVMVVIAMEHGKYFPIVSGVFEFTDADKQTSIRQALRSYVEQLEQLIRKYPDQWFTFYPFWAESNERI